MELVYRGVNKLTQDGFHATYEQGKREIFKRLSDPFIERIYSQYSTIERDELRTSAVMTEATNNEYLKVKEEKDKNQRSKSFYYRPGDRFVSVVENARIIGSKGVPLSEDDQIIADCLAPPYNVTRRSKIAIRSALWDMGLRDFRHQCTTPRMSLNTAVHLFPSYPNYYHWTAENLLKLHMVLQYGEEYGTYPDILVPKNRPEWIDDSLDIYDYPGKIIGVGADAVEVDKLIVPNFPDPTIEELEALRDRMFDNTSINSESDSPRRLFVARQDATIRRVRNYDVVRSVLSNYGFKTVIPSEYTVSEQIHLFNDADVIIGPHGAGLTNLIYASDTSVVELWSNKLSTTFERLCETLEFSHHRLQCESDRGDLSVDTDDLKVIVDSTL